MIGRKCRWDSQSQGTSFVKEGIILLVMPSGKPQALLMADAVREQWMNLPVKGKVQPSLEWFQNKLNQSKIQNISVRERYLVWVPGTNKFYSPIASLVTTNL